MFNIFYIKSTRDIPHIGINSECGIQFLLTLSPALKKTAFEMSSEVVCCMYMLMPLTYFGKQTNSVDLDQTAPFRAV